MKANTISAFGTTYQSQREAASIFGIPESTLRNRLKSGWDIEAALTAPTNGEVQFGHRDTQNNTCYKVVWSENEVIAHDIARFYNPEMVEKEVKHCITGIYEIVEELNTILNKALNDEDGIEELAQYLLIFYLVFVNDRPGYDEVKLAAEKIKAARNIAKAIIQHDIVNPYCDEIFLKVLKLIDAFIKVGIYESIITSSDLRIMFQKSNWTDCDWLD